MMITRLEMREGFSLSSAPGQIKLLSSRGVARKSSCSVGGVCAFILFFLLSLSPLAAPLAAQQNQPYLVPKQIYVGDLATLVVPLPPAAHNAPDVILTKRETPSNENIDIHKVTLERRTTGSGLLIEFSAFVPGEIELPLIEIGGEFFEDLTVKVNSLLENEAANATGTARLLSSAASVLAMPGTALMLYGSIAVIIFLILLAIWFAFKGRVVLKNLREKWKRYRLYAGMFNTERRLSRALAKSVDKRIILDKLSFEFREFLSILTGKNCRSMTAREFAREFACVFAREATSETPLQETAASQANQVDEGTFLGIFFGSCDKLRFSGTDIDTNSITKLLDELKEFLTAKQKEEKAKGDAK